jgi:hypothetical protein
MRWDKRGLVFQVEKRSDWMWSHAQLPSGLLLDDERLRVFFGTRDTKGRTRPTFVDVSADEPSRVLFVADRPLLDLGPLGAFDESGVMPSCVVREGDRIVLYYIGWSRRVRVPYHLAIGVAASDDGGETLARVFEGPILDRTAHDPYFTTAPYVCKEGERWRMWYVSCTGWITVDGLPEPVYETKYAESFDGLVWERPDVTCVARAHPDEAIGRASVIRGDIYRMWYCFRGSRGHRTNPQTAYRLGYAESSDGISWRRRDDEVGIDRSESGWDSVMQAYPYVYEREGRKVMLYNGNGFGESGFGYAVLDDE